VHAEHYLYLSSLNNAQVELQILLVCIMCYDGSHAQSNTPLRISLCKENIMILCNKILVKFWCMKNAIAMTL